MAGSTLLLTLFLVSVEIPKWSYIDLKIAISFAITGSTASTALEFISTARA